MPDPGFKFTEMRVGKHPKQRIMERLGVTEGRAIVRIKQAFKRAEWSKYRPDGCTHCPHNGGVLYGISEFDHMVLVVYPNSDKNLSPVLATVYRWDSVIQEACVTSEVVF